MHEIFEISSSIGDFLVANLAQPWVWIIVFALCWIDGFFPPIPSEAVVLSIAAIGVNDSPWILLPLMVSAAVGALLGDLSAFCLGRRSRGLVGRSGKSRISGGLERYGQQLQNRGMSILIVARFIPIGRVGINAAAGASGYSLKKFACAASIASIVWASYTTAIGTLAGQWFSDNPLLGAAVALAISAVLAVMVEQVVKALGRARAARSARFTVTRSEDVNGSSATEPLKTRTTKTEPSNAISQAKRVPQPSR